MGADYSQSDPSKEMLLSDSRSRKSKVRNRPNEAWATDTVIISEDGDGDENDNHDVIFGLRNALLASGLIWALLIIFGFAVFG